MQALEAQFHPGYDFLPHSSAIDYFDSLDAQVSALDHFDCDDDSSLLPDLCFPGSPGYDSDSSTNRIPSSRHVSPPSLDLQGDGSDDQDPNVPAPFTDQSLRRPLSYRQGLQQARHDWYAPPDIARGFLHAHQDWYVPPDIADIDASEPSLFETSIPRVPVIAPVPGPEIIPQGNGPGKHGTISYEPPQPPKHGGWWFHVDTGADVHVTYFPEELAHRVHSAGHCGTAGSTSMNVVCEGMWVLQGPPSYRPEFHAVLTALGCPGAKRRLLSLHAMARSGYDCVHHVRSHVQVTHRATNTLYRLSCTTNHETDFVELIPCKASLPKHAYGEINAIDLAKTIKGPALFHLLHLRLGCLGVVILKRMISQCSVQALPPKVEIPDNFNCPIYLRLKSQTVSHRPRASLVLNVKGDRFHMDFGFFNVPSIRVFQSFLVIVEAVTSYTWVFLHRNKNPPIALNISLLC
jgi:hypothetical protein